MSNRIGQSDIPTIAVFSGARPAISASLLISFAGVLLALTVGRKRLPFTIVASIYLAFSVAGIMNRKNVPGKIVLDIPLLLPGLLAIAIY